MEKKKKKKKPLWLSLGGIFDKINKATETMGPQKIRNQTKPPMALKHF